MKSRGAKKRSLLENRPNVIAYSLCNCCGYFSMKFPRMNGLDVLNACHGCPLPSSKAKKRTLLKNKPDVIEYRQCNCCGYYSMKFINGSEESNICPVCFWEDWDYEGYPDDISDCNRMSLRQAHDNFIKFGAMHVDLLEYVLPVVDRGRYRYDTPPAFKTNSEVTA